MRFDSAVIRAQVMRRANVAVLGIRCQKSTLATFGCVSYGTHNVRCVRSHTIVTSLLDTRNTLCYVGTRLLLLLYIYYYYCYYYDDDDDDDDDCDDDYCILTISITNTTTTTNTSTTKPHENVESAPRQ